MALSLSRSWSFVLPWQRRVTRQTAAAVQQATQEDVLRRRREQAHRAYIASIGELFGVDLSALSTAQFLALSRFISEQQSRGLLVKNSDLANLAGVMADFAYSTDTIALRLTQAGKMQAITATPSQIQALGDVLRTGLAAIGT